MFCTNKALYKGYGLKLNSVPEISKNALICYQSENR